MREIKFRGWNKKKKTMFYDVQSWFNYIDEITVFDEPTYELMQYTGLKDKNGKEIYEGDIVYYHPYADEIDRKEDLASKACIYQMSWTDDCYGGKWGWDLLDGEGNVHEHYYGGFDIEFVEVIGNIYENPELLK